MKETHLHKYKKVNLSRSKTPYIVYKCMVPGCPHYVPIELAENKVCACSSCGEAMIITREVLTHSSSKPAARPRCPDCIKRKNAKDINALAEFLASQNKS